MKNPWKKLSSKVVHKNPWYAVRKDKVIRPDGKKGEYNVVEFPPSVFIVAINEKKEVLLVQLFRYTTSRVSIEIPAGNTEGQRPLFAAKRELLEETGYKAKQWKQVGKFQAANGILNTESYVYLAQDLTSTEENSKLEEGITKVFTLPFEEVLNMVQQGKFTDGQSMIALFYAALELGYAKK